MRKFVFKNGIINLVLGLIIIAFAIVAQFVLPWISDFINYIIAAVLIIYSVLYLLHSRNKYKDKNAMMILTIQSVTVIVLAILIILRRLVGVELAVGIVLYMHGFVYLLILQLLKLRSTFTTFLINVAVLTLGAYVIFGRPSFVILEWALFIVLVAYGVLLVVLGIEYFTKNKRSGAKK